MTMTMGGFLWRSVFNTKNHLTAPRVVRKGTTRRRSIRPRIEALEDRCLLSTAFLQGFSFVDSASGPNANARFDAGEQIAGAAISLYAADTTTANLYHAATSQPPVTPSTVLASVITGADGYYLFNDASIATNPALAPGQVLQPGHYQLVETPPLGYFNNGVDVRSVVTPGTGVSASTIQVTLENPARLLDHLDSMGAGAMDHPTLDGADKSGFTGQLNIHLTDSPPPETFTSPVFPSLCMDISQTAGVGTQFPVVPISTTRIGAGWPLEPHESFSPPILDRCPFQSTRR
jgi:hypothetical protein